MKLDGIKVLDLSSFLPGPHLTMMMADHGADVIRIEPPGGEPTRQIGVREAGSTVYFRNTQRGKRSLMLDLKQKQAVDIFMRLAERADVIVESFRPGVVDRLGVGYDAVKARAPRVVYCSISAYGQDGPSRDRPTHDLGIQAELGLLAANTGADGRPAMPAVPAADATASLMALNGILMALLRRTQTGRGDYIDIAMMDTLLAWMPNVMGPVFGENRMPNPRHERTWGGHAMYNIYETADGRHLVLGGSELKFTRNLLTDLGRPDLVALCQQGPGPVEDPVRDFFRQTFRRKTLAQWMDWFKGRDVCVSPVNDMLEAIHDPHVQHRKMVVTDGRGLKHLGIPIKFRDEPGRIDFAWPELGAHGPAILRDLGYADDEVARLREKGVI
ncbi:CaiB/BaiF CoA-transferase family protein [Vineibacter terrae]|uniref:CaiB/BaiF CoA transferase family protein n=1 Tax=Vineibacter terrae TaxID=2586908 RepID=UPI002E362235|nr:CaiB/BaiF CoA-transferase family protein [Vineibacter terrae]HEX2891705.1 CaiB/BaiF CoA-transferase family protein [Vineibacter terrae]